MTFVMCLSLFNGLLFQAEAMAAEDGLVVHLKFDDDLTDSSGNGNNATCEYGKITYEDGIHGKSAVFNGKSYIEILDNDTLDVSNITISLWAYKNTPLNAFERVPYVYKQRDEEFDYAPYKLYEFGDNRPILNLHEYDSELDQFAMEGASIDLRKWHLLTATFNGKEARIYENGELLKKQNCTGAIGVSLGDIYIGVEEDGDLFFKGNMDDLRIYNRALSAKDVVDLYDKGLDESPELLTQKNSLIAHYKFNGDYKDASGFSNDAELAAGKVTFEEGKNGKAAKFKKGTYLEVPDNASLDFDEGFTMTGWIKTTNSSDMMAVLNRPGVSTSPYSESLNYRIQMMHDYYDFYYVPFDYQTGEEGSRHGMDKTTKNKWVHLGVTFDTKEIRWYINSKLVQKEEVPDYYEHDMAHGLGDLMIGSDGELYFVGTLDELKLYNYKLNANEIKEDYKEVDSLSISKDNQSKIKSLKKGSTVTLATSRKYIETGKSSKVTSGLTYKTSSKKVFTVTSKGVVKAVGKGSATLTITHGGISKTYKVTVK